MIEQTGNSYQSSKYAKSLFVSESKVGKTCSLTAWTLGVFPWQKAGGVIDKPENLHIMTFDANALGNIQSFLMKTCGAAKEALNFKVYNMQDDFRRVSSNDSSYDASFYNAVFDSIKKIQDRAAKGGVHVVIPSSLTGLAAGIERGIFGPPRSGEGKKGYGDQDKWKALSSQLHELQNYLQQDDWHCLWEAHVDKGASSGMGDSAPTKESIRVSGEAGRSWGYNVEQIFKIRRNFGSVHPGTKCDKVVLDTKPSIESVCNGRGFSEFLNPTEEDMAIAFSKLGLKVGGWNKKETPASVPNPTK